MGIWSRPVGVYCEDKHGAAISGKDVKLHFAPNSLALKLESHSTKVREDCSFEESIMTTCDTAQIYGYLDEPELRAWDAYFDVLMALNPDVEVAEAHFYCTDSDMPYYARMERERYVEWFRVYPGNLGCYSLKVEADWEREGKEWEQKGERTELVFEADRYAQMYAERRQLLGLLSEPIEASVKHYCRIIAEQNSGGWRRF
jgi:hypothetical protein